MLAGPETPIDPKSHICFNNWVAVAPFDTSRPDAAQNLELRMPVLVHGVAVSGDVFVPVERALVILAPKRRLGLVKLFQAGEDIRIVRVAFRLGTE